MSSESIIEINRRTLTAFHGGEFKWRFILKKIPYRKNVCEGSEIKYTRMFLLTRQKNVIFSRASVIGSHNIEGCIWGSRKQR